MSNRRYQGFRLSDGWMDRILYAYSTCIGFRRGQK